MVRIYTKTGDKGTTSLFGGKRVSKDDPQVRAYGAVDEFSTTLGVVMTTNVSEGDKELLTKVQRNLYHAMNALCGGIMDESILTGHTKEIEAYIDEVENELPKLHRFILPQGTPESVWFHMARTVCRRAEREVIAWVTQQNTSFDVICMYLNRLSDLLFVLSRRYNGVPLKPLRDSNGLPLKPLQDYNGGTEIST